MHCFQKSVIAALLLGVLTAQAGAQRSKRQTRPPELRGSRPSVEKMYEFARSQSLPFYLTPTNVNTAVSEGKLVALAGDGSYALTNGVGFSYVTPEARQFVSAFAPAYLAACGQALTVTSAARPYSNQPRNANPLSVHPTGIAVDLRRPAAGPCLTWLRNSLAHLELAGIVEATEERRPVHFHVAVLVPPGQPVALPDLSSSAVATWAASRIVTVTASAGEVSLPKRAAKHVRRTASARLARPSHGQ